MRSLLGILALALACLSGLAGLGLQLYDRGYRKGFQAGENWWLNAENGVELEREKIWREE